ncbi:MAG: A/G-specific adenine glycosylase [Chloroflexi bacterium]|nr:A/G-specific adenine glycosylase [Chloroflexota bacterium]
MKSRRAQSFSRRLLAWYAKHKRDLPWRRAARDPYRVWVSEILLQQTQVATVIPYYKKFLARFPTVHALARAKLDTVLKTWEGVGYYARARNLHRAAKEIRARFDGKLPTTVAELLTLPGIGRYTASAIASIAFDRDAAIVDGNVTRVLCRFFGIRRNIQLAKTKTTLWDLAAALVPRGRAGDYNQALMDLGATICAPRNPTCARCPLTRACRARRLGIQEKIPIKTKKKKLPHYVIGAGVIYKGKQILIAKRNANDLLGGLWEFPGGKRARGESLPACVAREVREEVGIEIVVAREIAVVPHAFSHFTITLHFFECRYRRGTPRALECAECKWVAPRALARYAFPAANRKMIQILNQRL